MSVRQADLVKLWGVSRSRVSQYVRAGMPLDSINAAESWRVGHIGRKCKHGGISKNYSTDLPQAPNPPTADELDRSDVHGVLARLTQTELVCWAALSAAMQGGSGDEVMAATRIYKDAADLRIKAEKNVLEVQQVSGQLINVDEARDVINKVLGPLRVLLKAMPATVAARANPADPDLARHAIHEEVQRILERVSK